MNENQKLIDMSHKGLVGAMGWRSNDDETIIKATALLNLISEKTGFMYSDGSNMPDELKEIQNFIEHLRSRRSISIQDLEDFYFQTGEDWHLWDEKENGPYPVDRIFNAMKKFIETYKSSSSEEFLRNEEYLKDELEKYRNLDIISMNIKKTQ